MYIHICQVMGKRRSETLTGWTGESWPLKDGDELHRYSQKRKSGGKKSHELGNSFARYIFNKNESRFYYKAHITIT